MAHESGASIFALPSGRRVATTTITPGWRPAATRFVDRGTARTWLVPWNASAGTAAPRAEMRVVDLAADGRSATSVFATASAFDLPFRSWGAVLPDARGQRLVTFDGGTHLRDGSTGALLATLADSAEHVSALFLSDGRVVVGEVRLDDPGRPGRRSRVFDRDGQSLTEMPLDLAPPGVRVGPEVAPGRVLVSSFRSLLLADGRCRGRGGGPRGRAARRPAPRDGGVRRASCERGPARSRERAVPPGRAGRVVRLDFASGAGRVTGPEPRA